MPYVGCLLFFGVPIVVLTWGSIARQREEIREAKLKFARDKAMELCLAWKEKQLPYVNKPGLFVYSRLDHNNKGIPGTGVYLPDPEALPETKPSAECVTYRSEDQLGVVRGLLIPTKYRSESWPCHRGSRRNPDYDPADFFSREYISCLDKEDLLLGRFVGREVYKEWRVDLEGNQLTEQ